MSWTDVVLVFVCLVGIMMFLLGAMRYPSRARKTARGVGSYGFPENGGRLAGGIVSTLAVGSVLDPFSAGSASGAVLAALVGCLAAALPEKWLNPTFGLIGIFGLLGTMFGFATDAACTDEALQGRLSVLVMLAISALIGAVVAALRGRLRSAEPLALFATLDILIFLEEPLGVSLFGQGWVATVIPLLVAGLLGYGGAAMPGLVIGLGAVGVGFATVLVSAGYGTMCSVGPDFAGLTMLILFAVGFAVTRAVVGRLS